MATVTALSWAVLAVALKYSLQFFSSGTIVWVRMVLAFAILGALFVWHRPEGLRILKQPPWLGLLAGVLIACNYFGFMKGIELTSASNAQIMIQIAPMSFAILSIFIFGETPTPLQLTGMLTAISGFGFFYWDQILVSLHNVERFQSGNLWLLFAAATWAVYALIQKSLMKKWKPQEFNLLVNLVSAVALFPTAHLSDLHGLDLGGALMLFFLAMNTVIAYGAFAEALARIPASLVSVVISVNPLLTLAIMTYLTQIEVQWISAEPIHWRGFLGAALVVAGVIVTVTAKPRLSTGT